MWAIRRASARLKNRGLSSGTTRIRFVKSEIASCYLDNYNAGVIESQGKVLDALVYSVRFYNKSSSPKSHVEARTFSSQAGVKSCGEQDDASQDASSELERRHEAVQEDDSGDVIGDESISDSELSEDESVADDIQNVLESLGTETDVGEKKSPKIKAPSAMAKAILAAPALPVSEVLGKWVKAGNEVTRGEILSTMLYLRKKGIFVKALELSEWSDSTKHLEFSDNHYASRVDLIARVRGIFKAEDYIRQIPESFRSEKVYRTLLASFAAATNVKKTEELFNKMKKLFPITCFSCNQLLHLYTRTDRKKIARVLLLMEKENIKPSVFTYKILIDVKGQMNDISQMEQIVEMMKYEGVEPNMQIQASLARHYAAAGLKDKAEAVLKEMEGSDIRKNLWVCRVLLPIYGSLGRDDEVGRIWKLCESNPQTKDYIAAIEAWGQLKRIEDAEAVFDTMLKKLKRPSSRHYAALLNVYANHNMLAKGKDLVRRMTESGITVLPVAWDALVKLFAGAGEVEKADSILEKALKQNRGKPLVSSYLTILDQYSKRGDVDNAERIFLKMREAGFTSRLRPYRSLLYAYINAKTPAYGFEERMKADNILPSKAFSNLLARASPFRASEVAVVLA